MSHSPGSSLPKELNLRFCLAMVAVIVTFVFGWWGMWQYEHDHHGHEDPFSIAYHTLQLFILHAPHLEHEVNAQIHVARFSAAVLVFWALIKGLTTLFQSDIRLRLARWRGGHVIVCGLGRLGKQLANEFHSNGNSVVVIEAHVDEVSGLPKGAIVLSGDACDADQLRRAGVSTAKQLIAVCDDVQTNVAIAATAGAVLRQDPKASQANAALAAWLFVPDAQLRQQLKRDRLFPHTGPRFHVNVRGLDLFSLAARLVLESNPLDYSPIQDRSKDCVHVVIVGFGPMGQRIALQTAQVGNFANFRKPKITVLEEEGSDRIDGFLKQYKRFKELIDFHTQEFSPNNPDVATQILSLSQPIPGEQPTVVLCWDSQSEPAVSEGKLFQRLEGDDAVNLSLALSMHQSATKCFPRTFLFQTRQCGFATLFGGREASDRLGTQVHVFGTLEETCSLDKLMHESTDAIARVLHQKWYDSQIEGGKKHGDKPSLWPWEQLDETYKESNRHAADHIRVKLRAIGYLVEEIRRHSDPLTSFDPKQVELLAEMEHNRWYAEQFLKNYSLGPRGDVTHPDLVPWNELAEDTKDYDRDQVKAIPEALRRAGLGIYVDRNWRTQINAPILKETNVAGSWFHAKKIRPIWARLLDHDEHVKTLEGNEKVPAGNYLCRGEAGDVWPQSKERLTDKYILTDEINEQGWCRCNPKPDADGVMAAQVPYPFQVQAEWGLLSGKSGDFIVKNYADRSIEHPDDIWIVDQKLFEATYERVA